MISVSNACMTSKISLKTNLKVKLKASQLSLNNETLIKVTSKLNNPPFNDRVFELNMTDIKELIDIIFENKESLHPIYRNDCLVCLKQWLMNGSNKCSVLHTNDDGKIAAHLFARDKLVRNLTTKGIEFKVLFQIDC